MAEDARRAATVTDRMRKWRLRVIATGVLVTLAIGGVVLAKKAGPGADVREIRIVVRDMAYIVAAQSDPNPVLRLRQGERVRFVLTNDDRGYSHNFVAPVLGLSTPLLPQGRTHSVEVTVPAVTGVFPYACGPHSEMMRGNIAIE